MEISDLILPERALRKLNTYLATEVSERKLC